MPTTNSEDKKLILETFTKVDMTLKDEYDSFWIVFFLIKKKLLQKLGYLSNRKSYEKVVKSKVLDFYMIYSKNNIRSFFGAF